MQTLLKVLLSTSSRQSLKKKKKKKKKAAYFLCALKEDRCEPEQHFDVHGVGLLVSLFLFSLPDLPGGVYPFPLRHLPGSVSLGWAAATWDVCRGRRGLKMEKKNSVCVLLRAWCWPGGESQSLPKLSCERDFLQRGSLKVSKCACVGKRFSVRLRALMKRHKGKPSATELNRNSHYS